MATKLERELTDLHHDVATIKELLAEQVSEDVAGVAKALKRPVLVKKDELQARARAAGENVRQLWAQSKVHAADARKAGEDTIRQNPLTSVALAFGAGYIIHKLIGRRY